MCTSNSIRVEKANEYVFNKLSDLLSNDKMVKTIVSNVNKERIRKVNLAKKELIRIDKELEKLDKKKGKLFEAYEDEIITKEEFQARKDELTERIKKLEEEGVSIKGIPSSFTLRSVSINTLSLNIAI